MCIQHMLQQSMLHCKRVKLARKNTPTDSLKYTYCPEPPLKVPMLGGLVDHDDPGVYWNDESES
jgi:hypothetical protein